MTKPPFPCRRAAALPLLLALAACSSPVELVGELVGERVGGRRMAITGGAVYAGHPSVARLTNGGQGQCTATLVGARTALTAAHCIDGGEINVILDSGERIAAVKAVRHPQWRGDGSDYDIAVVQLARAPSVAPSAVATRAPTVGLPIVLIGFGVTMCQEIAGTDPPQLSCTTDGNIKRRGENRVAELQNGIEFSYEGTASTCKGDSGGPAFATMEGREVLLGVTSRGTMPCGSRGVDTRVDVFVDWISQVAAGDVNLGKAPEVHITAPSDKTTLPAGPVQVTAEVAGQSGGVAQAQLLVDGAVKATATGAPLSFAVELPPGPHVLKVVAEDPMGNRGDATVAVTAVSGGTPAGPTAATPGSFGAECTAPEQCDSGLCARDGSSGLSYCTAACEPSNTDSCPTTSDCMPTASGQHVCALHPLQAHEADPQALLVGGCQVGAAAPPASALPLVLLALGWARRRRRR